MTKKSKLNFVRGFIGPLILGVALTTNSMLTKEPTDITSLIFYIPFTICFLLVTSTLLTHHQLIRRFFRLKLYSSTNKVCFTVTKKIVYTAYIGLILTINSNIESDFSILILAIGLTISATSMLLFLELNIVKKFKNHKLTIRYISLAISLSAITCFKINSSLEINKAFGINPDHFYYTNILTTYFSSLQFLMFTLGGVLTLCVCLLSGQIKHIQYTGLFFIYFLTISFVGMYSKYSLYMNWDNEKFIEKIALITDFKKYNKCNNPTIKSKPVVFLDQELKMVLTIKDDDLLNKRQYIIEKCLI